MKEGLIVVNGHKHFRSGPRCQCCNSSMKGAEAGIKACATCVVAECKEGYARFWTRGKDCPRRTKAKKAAVTARRPDKNVDKELL
jgi:hypothetical protein